jgi:hypothetical protein
MTESFGLQIVPQDFQLKCDAPGCSHVESVVVPSEADIGRACPQCGSNLLTAEDFAAAKAMLETMAEINKAFPIPEGAKPERGPLVSINPHAGELHITIGGGD